MKNILISGGNSFIARHLLQKIDKNKYKVTALVRDIENINIVDDVIYHQADMNKCEEVADYIGYCDIFVPFAWSGNRRGDLNNKEKNEYSYIMTYKMIECLAHKCMLKKVILPGSYFEYGGDNRYPVDEETECNPVLQYGIYKLRLFEHTKKICSKYHVEVVELRFFSLYGEDDKEEKFINDIVKKMIFNKDIQLTECKQLYSLLYIDDAIDAIMNIIETDDIDREIFNVSSCQIKQLRFFVEEIKKITGSKSDIKYGVIPYTAGVPHVVILSEKMNRYFGWHPKVSLTEGVKKLEEYYKEKCCTR